MVDVERVIECVQIMLEVENLRIPRQRSALFADSPRRVPTSFSYTTQSTIKNFGFQRPPLPRSNPGGDPANAGRLPEGV